MNHYNYDESNHSVMLTYLLFSKCLEKFVFVYCIGIHWFGNHQKGCVPLKRKMHNTIFNNDKQHFSVRFLNLRFLKFNCNLMWLSISAQLGFYLTLDRNLPFVRVVVVVVVVLLQHHWGNFNHTWHKASFCWSEFKIAQM